jgi:ribonuclease M5
MSKFKQIIVVEGRDDTKRLHEAFGDVDTIETRGSAISEKTLALDQKSPRFSRRHRVDRS